MTLDHSSDIEHTKLAALFDREMAALTEEAYHHKSGIVMSQAWKDATVGAGAVPGTVAMTVKESQQHGLVTYCLHSTARKTKVNPLGHKYCSLSFLLSPGAPDVPWYLLHGYHSLKEPGVLKEIPTSKLSVSTFDPRTVHPAEIFLVNYVSKYPKGHHGDYPGMFLIMQALTSMTKAGYKVVSEIRIESSDTGDEDYGLVIRHPKHGFVLLVLNFSVFLIDIVYQSTKKLRQP